MTTNTIKLPNAVALPLKPLFEALPLEQSMHRLVVEGSPQAQASLVQAALDGPDAAVLRDNPPLVAALWLYVDDLDRSHTVSQGVETDTGSYWHGIMHRREGDFTNSHYWFRRVGKHPAMSSLGSEYNPHQLIDQVEATMRDGSDPAALIDLQQREWANLFRWCALHPA